MVNNVYKLVTLVDQKDVKIPLIKARQLQLTGVSERVLTKINKKFREIENCDENERSFVTSNNIY